MSQCLLSESIKTVYRCLEYISLSLSVLFSADVFKFADMKERTLGNKTFHSHVTNYDYS